MRCVRIVYAFVMALGLAPRVDAAPERIWILPFENAARDPALGDLSAAVPDLLTVFIAGDSLCAVVERDQLDRILAEHGLARRGLAEASTRNRVGRLLGATAMITGSFVRQGNGLIIIAHVTDIQSGRVRASRQAVGNAERLGETVRTLARDLVRDLPLRLPRSGGAVVDPEPMQNLHFLRGLSYFYASRPPQALAEFIQAGRGGAPDVLPAYWRANCYLAMGRSGQAYVELIRLKRAGAGGVSATDLEARLQRCRAQLGAEQAGLYERLAAAGSRR